jgi:polyisoprenoid-binding protein YceI
MPLDLSGPQSGLSQLGGFMSTTTETAIPAGTYTLDTVHSHVGFAVKHMVVATFRGRFETFDATLEVSDDGAPRLIGTVDVTSIEVKDDNLAAHLQSPDFFDTERHPELRFESDSIRLDGGDAVVDGRLTIKGQTRPVEARGTIVGPHEDIAGNTKLGLELTAIVDRTEFGLKWNAPLPKGGMALGNDVTLSVDLELVKA